MTRKELIIKLWNITQSEFKKGAEFYRSKGDIPTFGETFEETRASTDAIYDSINEYTEKIEESK